MVANVVIIVCVQNRACVKIDCLKKPDRYDEYGITNSHGSLIILAERDLIQFSIHCVKKFLNWLGTSCVVSIATVATWRSVSPEIRCSGYQVDTVVMETTQLVLSQLKTFTQSVENRIRFLSAKKISKCCELLNLCHINSSGRVF